MRKSRLSDVQQSRLIEHFVAGTTARCAAERVDACETQVRKLLPLVNQSPAILKHALTSSLPRRLTLDDLLHAGQDLDWNR